jgi:tubulin-specific chaperone A
MPPPSALAISTSSVRRLLKEEASYHKELADQEANIRQLEEKIRNGQASEDGNDEYVLKQQVSQGEE